MLINNMFLEFWILIKNKFYEKVVLYMTMNLYI
jgi:hypothetical protein